MKIVFSIGGSIFAPEKVDSNYASAVAAMLRELSAKHQLAAVVGGGKPARAAIAQARARGASWAECDQVGILATRENARALIAALGGMSNSQIPTSIHEAAALFGSGILVMGGTEPGHSTDAVAALIADWVKADLFVNASNVAYVYDKNPRKYANAKPLKDVGITELMRLLESEGSNAGEYPLLDSVALKVIARAGLKTVILDGADIDNMKAAVSGEAFRGTTVNPQPTF